MKSILKKSLFLASIFIGGQAFSQTQPKVVTVKQAPLKRTEVVSPPKKIQNKGIVARKASPAKRELEIVPVKK